MEADREVPDSALQPLPPVRAGRWHLSEIQALQDLFPGDGPPGRDSGLDESELVRR